MKAFKWIFIVIVVIILVIVGIGYIMPKDVSVTTTEEINLPPAKVFHFVAGFVDRTAWDPWIKADTAVKCTFDIKAGYVGSVYSWEGPKLGIGKMEVDSIVFGSYLLNKVSFAPGRFLPEEWTFTPTENGTNVKWTITMSSGSPFGRIFNSLLKKTIQKTMESGKTELKKYIETHDVRLSTLTEIGIEEYPPVDALTVSGVVTMQEMPLWFGQNLGKVMAAVQTQNAQPQGMPFAVYSGYDTATGKFMMTAGMPVSAGARSSGDVVFRNYKGFVALKGLHRGPYDELAGSYEALERYAADNSIKLGDIAWEFYLNDPSGITDPTLLLTVIAMPLK
jgi:effector-binding domain-containing protein/uncharacterized protein YndB with AHSA1/START domain